MGIDSFEENMLRRIFLHLPPLSVELHDVI